MLSLLLSWDTASGLDGERSGERGFIVGRVTLVEMSGFRGLGGGAGNRGIMESLVVRSGDVRLTRGWCFSCGRKSRDGRGFGSVELACFGG